MASKRESAPHSAWPIMDSGTITSHLRRLIDDVLHANKRRLAARLFPVYRDFGGGLLSSGAWGKWRSLGGEGVSIIFLVPANGLLKWSWCGRKK